MVVLAALGCGSDPRPHPVRCAAVGAVAVDASAPDPLERTFSVDLADDGPLWVLCVAADGDQVLGESTAPALHHDLVVRGLRAKTAYTCEVHADCGPVESVAVTTGGPPIPAFEVESPEGAGGAYTLFNVAHGSPSGDEGSWLVIVDSYGAVRWAYRVGSDLIVDLDAALVDAGTAIHVGGGWAWFAEDQSNRGVFRDVDLSGRTLLDRAVPDFGLGFNHHSQKLADGTYLSLTGSNNANATDDWYGVGIEQWDPARGVVWSWSSQHLVDEGVLAPPSDPNRNTPYHANAVAFVDDAWGSAVWVSLYAARELWRLDRDTGERTHVFGPNGDFRLVDPTGAALGPEHFTYVQHDPEYGPDGHVLMYDNGQGRPVDVPYSRVVEFRLDLDALTATELWDWREDGWYDPVLGDANRLPNGNVLVAKGFNVAKTPTGLDVSQILELEPPDHVVWRLRFTDRDWELFRAERIDGCALFANPASCPAVAARIRDLRSQAPPK